MRAYYNEFDPKAAQWLRQLIANGLIMDGVVDDRSILEVSPGDLKGFTRHHFFAGIGGWDLALQLAKWPIDRPVCTASLPCQPFSVAGAQKGKEDERHLLPHFIELVKQCNFSTIFGEQVPGAIKHGWLDDLCTEMEREKYTVGSIVLTAAGAGAPHIRQRLYWVANRINEGSQGWLSGRQDKEREIISGHAGCSGTVDGMEDTISNGQCERPKVGGVLSGLHQDGETCNQSERRSEVCGMGNTKHDGCATSSFTTSHVQSSEERRENGQDIPRQSSGTSGRVDATGLSGCQDGRTEWDNPDWIYCRDEKYRPIKSSSIEIFNGFSAGLVCCCNSSQQGNETSKDGEINANASEANSGKILSSMQCENGQEHGGLLRSVWKNNHATCTSCGRKSFEQLTIEFDDVVRSMPQRSTLTQFFGFDGSEYMQTLQQTSDESRSLLDSQYPLSEIWKSLDDQEKDRVRVHFNYRSWIFTESLKPLANGLPKGMGYSSDPSEPIDANNTQEARVMRLKGYGNAIVPQTAASFIKAFMEV